MLHQETQASQPPRIGPGKSLSSVASREQSYPVLFGSDRVESAQRFPRHDELVIQRKEAMRADLKHTPLSRAQVADELKVRSGVDVNERTIERWVDTTPEGLRRRMSAEMGVYWCAVLGSTRIFDELLDEIEHVAVPEPHKIIAASYLAKVEAEQSLADALRRTA